MFDLNNYLQKELAELVDRHTPIDGPHSTLISSLSFSRCSIPYHSTETEPPYKLNNPSLCIVLQGLKDIVIGKERFRYGPPHYLVASMDLPIIAEVLEATPEVPNLTCKIEFTPGHILELVGDDLLKGNSKGTSRRGMNVGKLDIPLLDAVVRLVRLLDTPEDILGLAPLFAKEILYKVLHGEHGDSLRQIVTEGSPSVHIKNAIEHILNHYQNSFRIEDLAQLAKMSVPSFHRHFKEITGMSPIQFQKQLRLQEARRLLLSGSENAADAAYQVGYESPTQFSREYSRMFGAPPKEDIKRFKSNP